ncbi:TIGR02391 family protein [bacterium]|nr:TIGR02391 family protein [bacterium]
MDYEQLRSLYGRLRGILESLPSGPGNFGKILADDYNTTVDEFSVVIDKKLDSYKIPQDQYFRREGMMQGLVSGYAATKIRQLISYLEYTYNLNEKILELGSLINAIENKELKARCLDLLTASGKFDRVINQATLVLEDTIRQKSGVAGKEGVNLVNEVFKDDPSKSILVIDGELEEHQGFAHICRGIMIGFRNPTHHKLIGKFTREDALKFCGFIDILLKFIDSAKVNR